MASKSKVINIYRPRIAPGETVHKDELFDILGHATGIDESTLNRVMDVLSNLMVQFHREGRPVHIKGLGIFAPHIGLNGALEMHFQADSAIATSLNIAQLFNGTIIHRENIGKSPEDFVAQWNVEHPEDPVNAD